MRLFITQLVSLFTIVICLHFAIVILCLVMFKQFSNSAIIFKSNNLNQGDIKYILGNSHPECAINDSLLPKNYKNVALSAEPLFYTVVKARNLIEENHKIDSIFIEFTNNSIGTVQWVLGDDRLYANYRKYFSTMTLSEHNFLLLNNPKKTLKTIFSLTPKTIWLSNKLIDGQYLYLVRNQLFKSSKKDKPTVDNKNNEIRKYNKENQLVGFKNLLNLVCTNPKIVFVFTRMPLHRNYSGFDNEIEYQHYVKEILKYSNCRYYDFSKISLPDSCFGDLEHLNYLGAARFTPLFYNTIKRK